MSARNQTCESSAEAIIQLCPWNCTFHFFARRSQRQRGCSLGSGSVRSEAGLLFVESEDWATLSGSWVVRLASMSGTAADVARRIHFTAPLTGTARDDQLRRRADCRYLANARTRSQPTHTLASADLSHQLSRLQASDPGDVQHTAHLFAPETDSLSRCTSWLLHSTNVPMRLRPLRKKRWIDCNAASVDVYRMVSTFVPAPHALRYRPRHVRFLKCFLAQTFTIPASQLFFAWRRRLLRAHNRLFDQDRFAAWADRVRIELRSIFQALRFSEDAIKASIAPCTVLHERSALPESDWSAVHVMVNVSRHDRRYSRNVHAICFLASSKLSKTWC